MTIAATFSPANVNATGGTVTVSLTGLTASTAYTVHIGADVTTTVPITADGSGNASFTWVPPRVGNHTFNVLLTTTTLAGSYWVGATN